MASERTWEEREIESLRGLLAVYEGRVAILTRKRDHLRAAVADVLKEWEAGRLSDYGLEQALRAALEKEADS